MIDFPGPATAECRTIDESRIVDLLMFRGWPIEIRQGAGDEARQGARDALSRLIALGLPFRCTHDAQRRFDPVEVTNFLTWAGRNRGDPTFERHYVSSARRLVFESHGLGGDIGVAPSAQTLSAARYVVTLRRRFNLTGRVPGRRVRLRLPVPVEDAVLTDLHVEFLPPAETDFETRPALGHVDILTHVPPAGEMTVGIRATFTAWPCPRLRSPEPLDRAEAALYTRPAEGLVKVTGAIQALADRLSGDEWDTTEILNRFWNFVLNEYVSGSIHYDQLSSTDPLSTLLNYGIFDCRLGSALLIALCRARRIPARMVSGYLLFVSAPAFHTWLEVWIEGRGWIPVDLYSWGLTTEHSRSSGWRDYYFGQIDHRMVFERLPRIFGGTGDIRLPPRWHMLNFADEKGATIEFRSMDGGDLVYAEHVEVERIDGDGSISNRS